MIKMYDRYNLLPQSTYCISEELQFALFNEQIDKSSTFNKQSFYLIVFRVLNTNKQDVVYNYIEYNLLFFKPFVSFLLAKNDSLDINREPGYFLSFLDSKFDSKLVSSDKPLYLSLNSGNIGEILNDLPNQISYDKPFYDILRIINRLILISNYDTMHNMLEKSFYRRHSSFIYEVLGSLPNYSRLLSRNFTVQENFSPSLINSCVFIVRDKHTFLNILSKNSVFSNLNTGPQKLRGELNSASNFISLLDKDFRESLWMHNRFHANKNITHKYLTKLDRSKFSFNNIHLNLGNVRWYSTVYNNRNRLYGVGSIKNINKGVRWLSTFQSEKVKDRDNLLQTCFKEIDDILKKKNITTLDVLQKEIEDLLFEGQSWYNESNKPKNKILYNNITYDFITNSKQTIDELLCNSDKFIGNTKTHGTEYIPWFKKILKQLGYKKVSDMLIQYFLYVVTNESVTVEDIETPGIPSIVCYNNFGKRVVNFYFYSRFLESSKKTYSDFKDNDYEYKKILEDSNFNARVGGFFIYALIESKLIKLNLDSKSDEYYKYQEYIRLTRNSRKVMRMNKDEVVFHLPAKLPMICPPKEYSLDKKGVKLGGYLLNDV